MLRQLPEGHEDAPRAHVDEAWPGDIIGLHNHGTIQIGDTFSEGEELKYTGIPYFAPELFRRVVLKDPLKMKQLQKGVLQLSEEGATQAENGGGQLVYLAPTRVNMNLTMERWPDVQFLATREL